MVTEVYQNALMCSLFCMQPVFNLIIIGILKTYTCINIFQKILFSLSPKSYDPSKIWRETPKGNLISISAKLFKISIIYFSLHPRYYISTSLPNLLENSSITLIPLLTPNLVTPTFNRSRANSRL